MSSLDESKTYKPYCRYIRSLDFRNLSTMLEDFKFLSLRNKFFSDGLQKFNFSKREYNRVVVDVVETVNAVGEAVTLKTSLLEEIAGHLNPSSLPRWIARSPNLQAMVLWRGDALANGAGSAIAENCEHFNALTVLEWLSPDADAAFAQFLSDLKPDTLEYFEMIGYNNIGMSSFEALGHHKSLQELKLSNLNQEAMQHLSNLKSCTELHTLMLEDNFGSVQLEALNNDVFVEVVTWLSSCQKLRDLTLKKFFDGPAILSQVLYSQNVQLTKLSLEGYTVRFTSSQNFHTALSQQRSLESLSLKGNGEDTTPSDLNIMVEGICHLTNLRELILKDVSDEFAEEHIINLALSLPLLEDFWTSGGEMTADVLPVLGNLRQLKNLTLYAMTQFPLDSILNFLQALDPKQQIGFNLSLMAADPDSDLSDQEQDIIREFIRTNLDGRFEFVLWREAESSDSEED